MREFDGVSYQIGENLAQPTRIAAKTSGQVVVNQ
jgi:hypothetical protein